VFKNKQDGPDALTWGNWMKKVWWIGLWVGHIVGQEWVWTPSKASVDSFTVIAHTEDLMADW